MKLKCANCETTFEDHSALADISDLWQRIEPGEIFPEGQCPECGSFVFDEDDKHLQAVDNIRKNADLLQAAKDVLEWETQQGGWEALHALDRDRDSGIQEHVKLLNPQARVRQTLEKVGLDVFFEIYEDQDEAIASFK